MTIFTDWLDGSTTEEPSEGDVWPAVWEYKVTDSTPAGETVPGDPDSNYSTPTEFSDYWHDPFTGVDEVPESSGTADTVFSEVWPGTDLDRGWVSYWEQLHSNLNALILRTARFFDWYGPYRFGGLGTPTYVGHYETSRWGRDIAQEVRVRDVAVAYHPAFALAPPGYDLIQFEDEDEPAPIDVGMAGRGRPVEYTGYRIEIDAQDTTVDGWPGEDEGPWSWSVNYTIRHRPEIDQNGGWVQRYLDGGNGEYGVIHDGDETWIGTGAPADVNSWDILIDALSTDGPQSDQIVLEPDIAGSCPKVLIVTQISGIEIPAGTGMPPDPDKVNTVDVTEMRFFATVVWPSYRYGKSGTFGDWEKRARANGNNNSGGWPGRARENGNRSGSWQGRARA